MVDIEELAPRFIEHVATLKSAEVVCTFLTAIEGWSRIELVPILVDMGGHNIGPRHWFSGEQSADLYLTMQGHRCVFEVMCLVAGADANKVKRFPGQLDRLQSAVEDRSICQGIAFVTLNYPRTGIVMPSLKRPGRERGPTQPADQSADERRPSYRAALRVHPLLGLTMASRPVAHVRAPTSASGAGRIAFPTPSRCPPQAAESHQAGNRARRALPSARGTNWAPIRKPHGWDAQETPDLLG